MKELVYRRETSFFKRVVAGFLLLALFVSGQDEVVPVTIDPFRLTIEVGNEAEFKCVLSPENSLAQYSWYYPDNVTKVSTSNTSRVYVDEATLYIMSAQENDTGLYLCSVSIEPNSTTLSSVPVTSVTTISADTNVTSDTMVLFQNTDGGNGESNEVEVYNATVFLNVYIMPSYFTEGMIILGVNLGLLLLFLICLAQSMITEKKRVRLYYKK